MDRFKRKKTRLIQMSLSSTCDLETQSLPSQGSNYPLGLLRHLAIKSIMLEKEFSLLTIFEKMHLTSDNIPLWRSTCKAALGQKIRKYIPCLGSHFIVTASFYEIWYMNFGKQFTFSATSSCVFSLGEWRHPIHNPFVSPNHKSKSSMFF